MDGTTNITSVDVIQAVRESVMLADISISMWNAEKSDRGAMEDLKRQNNATGDVGRVVKNMLAGADLQFKELRSAFTAVRTSHYAMTLPWVSDPHAERQRGPRLLPHMLFDRYLDTLAKQRRAANAKLDAFCAEYPNYVAAAKANLGGLADAMYPSADEVRANFRIHFDFEPLPAGASFKGLPQDTIDRLAKALHGKQQRMVDQATAAMWGEVRDRVGHIVNRLGDPETRFKSSTIDGVRELVTLLPGWNLVGSPEVGEITEDIKRMLEGVDPKVLRDNQQVRSDVAAQAQAVVDKMNSWNL